MKPGKFAARLFRLLIGLAMVSFFVVLDWYPLVRELGGLRREQSDLKRKTAEHNALSARFVFPDAQEQALLAGSDSDLQRALPRLERDDAWAAIVLLELQARVGRDRFPHVRVLFTPQVQGTEIGVSSPGKSDPLADWLFSRQIIAVGNSFAAAFNPKSIHCQEIISSLEPVCRQKLASRPLAIAAMAPLTALLDFIDHVSWGETRLEIVRLYMEPGASPPRAWLLCRGNYLSASPSRWLLPEGAGSDDDLLIDPDSPLLEQRVVPGR
jgi:hypothetical protein